MKKLLTILILITVATSCVTQKKCDRKFPPVTTVIYRDSTITITKYRDTTVYFYIPPDTVIFTDTVVIKDNQVQVKPSFLRVKYAHSEAYIHNNRLYHTLIQNEDSISVTLNNAIRETWERAEKHFSKTETKIIEKKYIPFIYKLLSLAGIISLSLLIYSLVKKLRQ